MSICYKFKAVGSSIKNSLLSIELGFKIYTMITVGMFIVTQLFPSLIQSFLYTPLLVVQKYEYWRLFSSILTNGKLQFLRIVFLLINFCFLSLALRRLEHKYSTPYLLVEIFKQNFIVNLLLTLIFYPFIAAGLIQSGIIVNLGTLVVTVNFVCQLASRSTQTEFNLLCMPMKLKYLPWVMLITIIGLVNNSLPTFAGIFIISMVQHYALSKPLFTLPLGFYQSIERILPSFVTQMSGYVKLSQVSQLQQVCTNWCKRGITRQRKCSDHSKFQEHWKEKQFDPPVQSQKAKQSEQITRPVAGETQHRQQLLGDGQIKCETSQSQVLESKLIDYKDHWKSRYADDQDEGQNPTDSHLKYNEIIVEPITHSRDQEANENFNGFVEVQEGRSLRNSANSHQNPHYERQSSTFSNLQEQNSEQQQRQKKQGSAGKVVGRPAPADEQQQWY